MDYKLLRALSILLQTGLVILLALLICLLLFSFKPIKAPTVKSSSHTEISKDILEQRFLNEIQKHRLTIKTLCFEKQARQLYALPKAPIAKATYKCTAKKA